MDRKTLLLQKFKETRNKGQGVVMNGLTPMDQRVYPLNSREIRRRRERAEKRSKKIKF